MAIEGEPILSRVDRKRRKLDILKKSVSEMREHFAANRKTKQRERAYKDICFWMDNAIVPFLEGIAEQYNEPLLDGIKRLIKEDKNPFRQQQDWNRRKETEFALTRFMQSPSTKVLQIMAKPYVRQKMQWIEGEAKWIREEILKEEYPAFYEAIMDTPGGKAWLDNLITDFMKIIKRYLRK